MFSTKIYSSWRETQRNKYTKIFDRVGTDFFSGLVLDIGAGLGYLQQFLKEKGFEADIITLDIEEPAQIIADGGKLPFRDNSFDAVISIDAMHLIKGSDFKRVLKNGGLALLALFFNINYVERKNLLKEKLMGFEILAEFELHGRENEYIMLARKSN